MAALTDALARFRRADSLAVLPFYVANEESLSQQGVLGRVWAPLATLERRLSIRNLPAKEGLDLTYRTASDIASWATRNPRTAGPSSCATWRCIEFIAYDGPDQLPSPREPSLHMPSLCTHRFCEPCNGWRLTKRTAYHASLLGLAP